MKYLIVLGLLLLSCEADIEKCRKYVEKSFGKVEFIYQNTSDFKFDIIWYSIEEDKLLTTNHGDTGWETTASRYLDDNELAELCSNNIAVIRRYHKIRKQYTQPKATTNKTAKKPQKNTSKAIKIPKSDEPWGEW